MNNQKLKMVFKLAVNERYRYLITKVADLEHIYLIKDENGDFVTCGTAENECIPVWPEIQFAEQFLNSDWKKCRIALIELYPFLDWLDKLEREGLFIGVFPDTEFNAVVVKPTIVKNDLLEECQRFGYKAR